MCEKEKTYVIVPEFHVRNNYSVLIRDLHERFEELKLNSNLQKIIYFLIFLQLLQHIFL